MFSSPGALWHVYTTVMTIDGVEISSGLYLMMQMTAYSEAEGYMEDENGNVLKTRSRAKRQGLD